MKNIIFISLILLLFSCNEDGNINTEPKDQTSELEGKYKFVSLVSNTALDLKAKF